MKKKRKKKTDKNEYQTGEKPTKRIWYHKITTAPTPRGCMWARGDSIIIIIIILYNDELTCRLAVDKRGTMSVEFIMMETQPPSPSFFRRFSGSHNYRLCVCVCSLPCFTVCVVPLTYKHT
jgi:hypothetical protein